MKLPNYIQDTNRFQLAAPPDWFLHQLYMFDPSLVIVPSRQSFCYRLAQRRRLKLSEKVVNDVLKEQADTRMLASYSLVPVTTILATANWSNPLIFVELQRRAPWRMGGAAKFTQMVEGQDRQDLLDKQARQDEHISYLAKDAWKHYNKQIGLRSHLWSPTTKPSRKAVRSEGHTLTFPRKAYQPEIMTTWLDPRSLKG